MNLNTIPRDLRKIIDPEQVDFFIKSDRNHPRKKATGLIGFSFFWNTFVGIFAFTFLGPLISGEKSTFKSGDTILETIWINFGTTIFPIFFIAVFALIGIGTLVYGIVLFRQKGGYFAGTETRLIKYRNGKVTINDWGRFSGNMLIKQKGMLGSIDLELSAGSLRSSKRNISSSTPDTIYMSGIKNVFEIEKKCRARIQENDPNQKNNQR